MKKIFYNLILGFIFSIASVGRFNFPLFIFIWPYCFLVYLHKNEKKLIPLIIVSLCLIVSNIIRWIGYIKESPLSSFVFGIHLSFINIIPYIIDDMIYNKITKWVSVFIFPLLVAFTEYAFEFTYFANNNVYAYALRNNLEIIQIYSLFGLNFLSFIIALFASILDYSYAVYKKEKKLTKFAYLYAIIIFLITCFGSIRLLFHDRRERFNVVSALGVSPRLYYEGKDPGLPVSEYIDYIQKTIMKANNTNAKLIVYSEDGFLVNATNRNEILNKTAKLAEKYNIFVVLTLDCKYEKFLKYI